ncbi:hypothetical protein DBR37_15055 [Herminiimonas sp. KBW02]|uniref:hypothetical protein n=1 Tax=Herminiimonas sp. KBW02 TaxID=2153363 RepID=UPI000F5AB262|nr:hypothetical protein [Herminiimonas sp. KBW02]RQO33510.1 hypothetical protein DBR37_15055 [Herminiimonas sp. KBW02]
MLCASTHKASTASTGRIPGVTKTCLLYRFPGTGKLDTWSFSRNGEPVAIDLPAHMMSNSPDPQVSFAIHGLSLP